MSRCDHCPAEPQYPCPGEGARRVCDLVDPTHPAHRPDYRDSVIESARQLGGLDVGAIIAEARAAAEHHIPDPNAPRPCGGCPPPA